MNKLPFPLLPYGDMLAALQDALQAMLNHAAFLTENDVARDELAQVLKVERANQSHGQATRRLVAIFREERHLPASDDIDEAFVGLINEILENLGLLEPLPIEVISFIVTGQVRRADGTPLPNLT